MRIPGKNVSGRETACAAWLSNSQKAGVARMESKEREMNGDKGSGGLGPAHDHAKGAFGRFLAE